MKKSNWLFLIFAAGFFITKMAYASSYADFFPYYYEYCAGTQVKYQKAYYDGAEGGIGGHGLFYINGLCKDYSKDYPQVIPCGEVKGNSISHQGVGISLDSDFKNVSWVAIPGRELTFFGDISPKKIDASDIDLITQKALDLKIFENVQMKSVLKMGLSQGSQEFEKEVILASIGTNLAVNWGRRLHCVRIPIEKEGLQKAANFLNNLNNRYYTGKEDYEWSMVSNNCTHLAINTSSALGLNKSIKTDKKFLTQIFNLAIPSNAYLMYMDKIVLKMKTLGAVANTYKAFPSNIMYKTEELAALTLPRKRIFRMFATPEKYDRYLSIPKYSSLEGNAEFFEKTYRKKLSKRKYKASSDLIQKFKLVQSILKK